MSEVSGSSGSRLKELLVLLGRARGDLAGNAVPPADVIEKLALQLKALGDELARWSKDTASRQAPDAETLETLRLAARARRELKAVADLARGSARFASLLKEVEKAGVEGGIYGRDGKTTGDAGSAKIERKA